MSPSVEEARIIREQEDGPLQSMFQSPDVAVVLIQDDEPMQLSSQFPPGQFIVDYKQEYDSSHSIVQPWFELGHVIEDLWQA